MEDMVQLCEIEKAARTFVTGLAPRPHGATIVGLSGELGAGKTTFSQALAKTLGVSESVTSPTFVIERVYALLPKAACGFEKLIHIDAYRLRGAQELESLGWHELVADSRNLILVEWPEKVIECIPHHALRITLSYVDERTRALTYAAA